MDGCGALAVNPLSINGIERPRAVEFEPAARADSRFFYLERIERFDRMQLDVCQARRNRGCGHAEILAEAKRNVMGLRLRGPAPRILSRDLHMAKDELRQKRAAEERHGDAQERANQEVFREALGFELRIAGDGFCRQDQADHCR